MLANLIVSLSDSELFVYDFNNIVTELLYIPTRSFRENKIDFLCKVFFNCLKQVCVSNKEVAE